MALIVKKDGKQSEAQVGTDGKTAREVYKVWDDTDAAVTPLAAYVAVVGIGINIGTAHPEDGTLVCSLIYPRLLDQQTNAARLVEVNYVSTSLSVIGNPLEIPDRYTIDTQEHDEDYYKDESDNTPPDNMARLTNGVPMHPLPKRIAISYIISIRRNVAENMTLDVFGEFNNKSNSDSVSFHGVTFDPGQLRLTMSLGDVQQLNNINYRELSINVFAIEAGWHQKFESRDKREYDLTHGSRPIKDGYGREVDFPWPLDATGFAKPNYTDDPAIIELQPYKEVGLNGFINGGP